MSIELKQALEALIEARRYVVGAYECAFPDQDLNESVMRQIDEAVTAIQQAEVTDEQVAEALESAGVELQRFMGGISGTKDVWTTAGSQSVRRIAAGVRAILALRPVQVPMTPTERERELDLSPVDASWEAGDAFMEGIYAAEAHHGITAQAKKGDA